ncbi:hypothetical protein HOP50_01g08070 [Chloropicon primus]|uniref:Uncharacterized protein n=1 Tax=Chloropicon primus TaxID=1764295 RepID=A0A5B8MDH8_9CHLO|nr:hypothetical protein A3770_01p08190 [Chloropicon primus]UPQ97512.1 hypothetical protein HOP50_01g08070 [Chloropicon primus]|mmetsp:Transcript_4262/g.12494  ORF Transcript_4262/g.12494 Transcript_4262/m.12494 type:complete len:220 (-) Transcript_4262:1256-1915(-)|eukprot:QDZ18301.1 hypothetical protein A3770_01p08190 [Chloropicon primus]
MNALVKALVKQKRLLNAMEDHDKKAREEERDESDLPRWMTGAEPAGSSLRKGKETPREEIKKFKIILGWRDNPKGPKKVIVIGGKEYDPYRGKSTLKQICPKKLRAVISDLSPTLWERFMTDLSSVVEPFQDASEDAWVPILCFFFPCFLAWRAKYIGRIKENLIQALVARHYVEFHNLGLHLRFKEIAAPILFCGMNVSQKVPVIEIVWDPSLWTDRI